jgi:hypothetical protein
MAHQAFSSPLAGLTAASVDETKSAEIPLNGLTQVGGTLLWDTGATSGKVVFEIAPTQAYSGTWEPIFSSDFVADSVPAAPSTQSFTYPGPFAGFGRWRIDTVIGGGTVTTVTTGLIG